MDRKTHLTVAVRPRHKPLAVCLALGVSMSSATDLSATNNSRSVEHHRPQRSDMAPTRVNGAEPLLQSLGAGRQWQASFPQAQVTAPRATLSVTNCNSSGAGSLPAVVAVASSGDTVDMRELTCSVISLDAPLVIPQDDLTLIGDGTTYIVGDGDALGDGMLRHYGNGQLELLSLDVAYGQIVESLYLFGNVARGGCVYSHGSVRAVRVIAKNCSAIHQDGPAWGGAIYARDGIILMNSIVTGSSARSNNALYGALGGGLLTWGPAVIKYSTIYDNQAEATIASAGGGIVAAGGGWIQRSTISGNSAHSVAGLSLTSDTGEPISLLNSTVSGNTTDHTSTTAGAWLSTSGIIQVLNNTVTLNENHSDSGAGLAIGSNPSEFVLRSNIISGNTWQGSRASDFVIVSGAVVSGDHNLIGWVDPGTSAPADTIRQIDAPLGPLLFHAGPTRIHVPLTGNWAFNLGSYPAGGIPYTDQNGLPRKVGAGVDIGSHESDALFLGRFENPPTSL